jgi:methionine-rich copper-binding protein CopC/putative copper export protein
MTISRRHLSLEGTTATGARARRTAMLLVLLFTAVVGWPAPPALAHTALVASTPAHRSVLTGPPATAQLVFVNAVDPGTVSIELVAASGARIGGHARTTPDSRRTRTVEFTLPPLEEGVYAIAWQSVGGDGHRVSGEVVFGVGTDVDLAAVSGTTTTTEPLDEVLDGAAALGRFLWYVGLSLLVGALYVGRCRALFPAPGAASAALAEATHRWLRRAVLIALVAAGVRGGGALWALARAADGATPLAVTSAAPGVTVWVVAAAVLALLFAFRPRDSTPGPLLSAGVVAVAVAGSLGGHAATRPGAVVGALVTSAHLLAAATWVGPLAVLSLGCLSESWHRAPQPERQATLGRFLSGYAPVAAAALAVVVASGVWLAAPTVGAGLLGSLYGLTLVAKIGVVVAVVLPLAIHHYQAVRTNPLGPAGVLRTVRTETLGLTTVVVLAALLAGLDPNAAAPGRQADEVGSSAGQAATVVNVASCAALPVGGPDCYRAYFADRMRSDGAEAALTEIGALSETDPYVGAQCHQVTHDLGRDAAEYYPTLSEALAFDATVCWSGYYHGVVEQELSGHDEDWLLAQMPTVCAQAATDPYSFGHYNCVHGLGHGVMLRLDGDLFAAIPFCERFSDQWERSSCLGGLFMQNVVSAQHGLTATVREGDLRYPCNAVDADYVDECYLLQTSYVLWQLDYDYAAAFAVCDEIEDAMRSVCYQSMGRDISGASQRDVSDVVARCALGRGDLRDECYVGAARDAVYTAGDGDAATPLCEALPAASRGRCLEVRDEAAARL